MIPCWGRPPGKKVTMRRSLEEATEGMAAEAGGSTGGGIGEWPDNDEEDDEPRR